MTRATDPSQGKAKGRKGRKSKPARVKRPNVVLRLGVPRSADAVRNVSGFLVVAVVTVLVTRAILAATGFPKLGGNSSLHVAHVLWGGLLMAITLLLLLSFAGPAIRPISALLGGIGFGLFIDEVGKFVTADNNYFYKPTAMLIYLVVIAFLLVGDLLTRRLSSHPVEYAAQAADQAVAGLAGGLTPRARQTAMELLAKGQDAPQAAEIRALLNALPDSRAGLPNPIEAAWAWFVRLGHRLVQAPWATRFVLICRLLSVLGAIGIGVVSLLVPSSDAPAWIMAGAAISGGVSGVLLLVGYVLLRNDLRYAAFRWIRVSVLVSVLVTQLLVFRQVSWIGLVGLAMDLMVYVIVSGEVRRLEQLSEAERLSATRAAAGGAVDPTQGEGGGRPEAAGARTDGMAVGGESTLVMNPAGAGEAAAVPEPDAGGAAVPPPGPAEGPAGDPGHQEWLAGAPWASPPQGPVRRPSPVRPVAARPGEPDKQAQHPEAAGPAR